MEMLEKVQQKATKMIQGISHLQYNDRLASLNVFPEVEGGYD